MAIQLVTAPTAQPMDLAEAKAHLRVGITDDDTLIGAIIPAIAGFAQEITKKQLVVARWKQMQDSFFDSTGDDTIRLQRFPVVQVVSVQYLDFNSVTQTVDPATYSIDYTTEPVRIRPIFGHIWPIPVPQIGSVWVTFDAGYAAAVTVSTITNAIVVSAWKPLLVGDAVRFSNSGGVLPAPLVVDTDYYVLTVVSPGVYTIGATSGGAPLVLTAVAVGSGTNYLGVVPPEIVAWMKLRLGAIYENREEEIIATRLTIVTLTFIDRMLDGFKAYEF